MLDRLIPLRNQKRTLGWNWNCTIEPTGASTLLGKYCNEPLVSDTDTTWTISWLDVDDDPDELPVEIGWHPAGHDPPEPHPLRSLLPDQELDPLLLPYWVAAAVAARNAVVRRVLRDIVGGLSLDFLL